MYYLLLYEIVFHKNFSFLQKLKKIFEQEKPDIVINFAAESHVDRSIENPVLLELMELGKSLLYFNTSLKANTAVLEKLTKFQSIKKYEEDEEQPLPLFKVGDVYNEGRIDATQKFTQAPARYTEAKLIKKMEDVGIGRPSTYAVTVETLKKRNYIKLERKAIYATDQGKLTSKKLDEYFNSVITLFTNISTYIVTF